MNVYAIVSIALLVYLVFAWFVASFLGLKSPDIWILRGGLMLLGAIGAATYIWYYRKEHPEAGSDGSTRGLSDVDLQLKRAQNDLAKTGRGSFRKLPVFFVLGDKGGAKTSTIEKSGMGAELVAGQVYAGNDILPIPTQILNCWLMKGAVFLEPGAAVPSQGEGWNRFLSRVSPAFTLSAPAPRAVLLCIPVKTLNQDPAKVAVKAQRYRQQLTGLTTRLGNRIPVYVVFTKLDELDFFNEYLAPFADQEIDQVLGATLPLSTGHGGRYDDEMTRIITLEYQGICAGLADLRSEFLQRQRNMTGDSDPASLAGIYEFPRAFRKLEASVVRFLIELCRPADLTTGPFLRGFYFCGARPVSSRRSVSPTVDVSGVDPTATSVFRVGDFQRSPQPAAQAPSGGRIPQWTFLGPIFGQLLPHDEVALKSSCIRGKAGSVQRLALIGATALAVLVALAMGISFYRNHSLIGGVADGTGQFNSIGVSDSLSETNLAALDSLMASMKPIEDYKEDGAPFSLRWGLYSGNRTYDVAWRAYSFWIDRLILADVKSGLLRTMLTPDDDSRFDAIKAYLMMTSRKDKVDPAFLSPFLFERWKRRREGASAEVAEKVGSHLSFYAEHLKTDLSPVIIGKDAENTIEAAQASIAENSARIYDSMLAEAAGSRPPIRFAELSPKARETFVNGLPDVQSAFTKEGWTAMQKAFENPSRFGNSEQWVLGGSGEGSTRGPARKTVSVSAADIEAFREQYTQMYISKWRAFLTSAKLSEYRDMRDAVAKLDTLQQTASPLLALLTAVAENTSVESPEIKRAFKATHVFNTKKADYMTALGNLQVALSQVYTLPDSESVSDTRRKINSALETANNAAKTLDPRESDLEIEKFVQALIRQPISMADREFRDWTPLDLPSR